MTETGSSDEPERSTVRETDASLSAAATAEAENATVDSSDDTLPLYADDVEAAEDSAGVGEAEETGAPGAGGSSRGGGELEAVDG